MNSSATAKWIGLALLGVAVAAAVAIAASNLVSRQIGIASESVSAGDALAPAVESAARRGAAAGTGPANAPGAGSGTQGGNELPAIAGSGGAPEEASADELEDRLDVREDARKDREDALEDAQKDREDAAEDIRKEREDNSGSGSDD